MSSWCIINQVALYNSIVLENVFFLAAPFLSLFSEVGPLYIDVCFLGENDLSVS